MADNWVTDAACRGYPPDQVLPIMCFNKCPVRHECLANALTSADWHRDITYDPHLVWGGYHAVARHKVMKETGFRAGRAFDLLLEREKQNAAAPYLASD